MGEIKYIVLSQLNNGEYTGTIEELFEEITIRVHPVEVDFFVVDDRVSPALFYLFSFNFNNDSIVQLNDIDLSNYLTDVKTLNTNNTSSLTAESSETISGTGVINLHKISKTGSYNDLLDKPSIPTIPEISITDNTSATDKPIVGDITASGHTITVSRLGLDDLGLASAYKYKGSVAKYENLPTSGLNNGDVYNVEESGMNYAWTGTGWDPLGSTVDLSGYMLKTDYKANTKDQDGYVTKGNGQVSKVWKTDASGNPGWRDDDNTTYSAGTGLLLNETTFSLKNTSINAHCQQGNAVHHCIALGFTKASTQGHYISLELYSRAGEVIKVNISSNDSTYFAQAVRITNTYGKIKTIYFNSTNGHLYVTTDVYANNLGCKIIACSEDIATPVITTVDSIPEGSASITVISNITGSGSNNYLAKFNGNNTITSGPALTGDGTKYLNNKGEWATIEIPDVDLSGYLPLSGGQLYNNAEVKFEKYGGRYLTIDGDSFFYDVSKDTGGWNLTLTGLKDPVGEKTLLGAFGSTSGLNWIYMGGTYDNPHFKLTASGDGYFANNLYQGGVKVSVEGHGHDNMITGSGTTKKIPVFTDTSTLGNSAIAMTDQDTVKIDTSSHASFTDPALHIHHYGPQAADDYAELMILSGLTRNPYGLRFRSHGSGTQIIQSQRIADNSECFGISLNPNGGNVAIGKQTASYKLDVNGNVGANGFIHSGLTAPEGKTRNDYVLLAGGETKAVSDFAGTTYGADRGISLVSGNFGHSNTAVTAVTTTGLYKIKYDAYGHITGTESFTLPTINNATLSLGVSGTGISGSASFTANSSTDQTFTVTLDSSADGNRAANKVVLSKAAGQINSEKYTITTGTVEKVTMQYDDSIKALKFVFA